MITWIGRRTARGERGAQHVEAAVLISTLMVLGALVLTSTTTLGQAVAQQWVCWTAGDGASCGGEAPAPAAPATRRSLAPVDDVTIPTHVADPAVWHQPPTTLPPGGTYATVGDTTVAMSQCDSTHCIATDGTLHECAVTSTFDPFGIPTTVADCSAAITAETTLTCADEGRSPSTDTCRGPFDTYYHCTDPAPDGSRGCRQADTDADAHLASTPSSCDTATDESSHVTCMGPNGTLYECLYVPYEGAVPTCTEAGRAIDSTDVTDCVADPGAASSTPAGTPGTDAVVLCTYTPDICFPEPTDGRTCADQAVTVRCLADTSGPTGLQLQHCNSVGGLVPPGFGVESVCVVQEAQGCVASTSVLTTPVIPPEQIASTTQVGDLEVQVAANDTTTYTIPTGETDENGDPVVEIMTYEQLTAFCAARPQRCSEVADATVAAAQTSFLGVLQQTGLCADAAACQQVLDQFAAASSQTCRSRCLLQNPTGFTGLQLGIAGITIVAGVLGIAGFWQEPGAAKTGLYGTAGVLGVVAWTLTQLQTRGDNRQGAANTAAIAAATAAAARLQTDLEAAMAQIASQDGLIATLRQQVASLQESSQSQAGALENLWNAIMRRDG